MFLDVEGVDVVTGCVLWFYLSVARTIKGGVSKGVVVQRYFSCSLAVFLLEHPFSEHFSKQQSTVMVPSHKVIDLPSTHTELETKPAGRF